LTPETFFRMLLVHIACGEEGKKKGKGTVSAAGSFFLIPREKKGKKKKKKGGSECNW